MSFEGYERVYFQVNGRDSILILPHHPREGNPWIWKTEFFEAFNFAERALLENGFALAYHRVSDLYGCPDSVAMMEEFYLACRARGLHEKPALFGFSRGGLYACNFALTYPDQVGMLYLDAPVLDIRSWPAGRGVGVGSASCWEECKACYGLDEESANVFVQNPLDRACELAKSRIPILLVCGAADRVVPYEENGKPFFDRVLNGGGRIAKIVKPDCDHHPHSLYDPQPICDFVLSCYGWNGEEGFSPAEISQNER